MADEITITLRLQCRNGAFTFDKSMTGIQLDQATARGGNPGVVNIGTSEEDVAFGDLTDPAYILIRNLDATNYVEFGMSDAGTMKSIGKIRPGGVALFERMTGKTLRMKANTAAVDVEIYALDR
jgi:hypothetical protein